MNDDVYFSSFKTTALALSILEREKSMPRLYDDSKTGYKDQFWPTWVP